MKNLELSNLANTQIYQGQATEIDHTLIASEKPPLYGLRITYNEIGEQLLEVWNKLPNFKIVDSFMLSKRITDKVIQIVETITLLENKGGLIQR